jgi:hypothetical protein
MNPSDEAERKRIEEENKGARAAIAKRDAGENVAYETKDKFEAIDAEFNATHVKVLICVCDNAPITEEIEEAADRMFDIALQLGDPLMLALCLARFEDFIKQRRPPPWTMLEHVNDAFHRYRASGGGSMDAAFGLKQTERMRPNRWLAREVSRTQSRFIEYFTQTMSDSKAIAKAEQFFNKPDLRRTYAKYRRIIKRK